MPASTGAEPAIIVFARAPQAGRAKTRLIPRLGPEGAARLQARLILQALRVAQLARCGSVELHGAPRAAHSFFAYCAARFKVELRNQKGRDLGERMHGAFTRALHRHRAVILIGSDCPELRPRDLRRAARLLHGACDAVIAPAQDGGYALIGLKRAPRALFSGIAWGEASVYGETRTRLDALGLRMRALRTVRDVDRPEDLAHARDFLHR
ncbi:MAG TPA: TIGR04282 family arsenosugar biosynthesis glycosyltransferase [Burkholderiales bacterium]|nr:TIGR04282 family arsenosugar biosynthesis glycosyltransferase [Burkholderiales bacterium]